MMTCQSQLLCRKAQIKIQRSQFLMEGKLACICTKPVLPKENIFPTFIEFERQKKLQKYVLPQKSIRILNIIGEGSHVIHV